ncbi:hypothetical protein HKX48_001390 [Thoreauomyces humboldtii]|nr:hypothetical protein HKX48_001390 [Thoreauomyces humboldtii]
MKRHKRHRSPTPPLELESCQQSKSGFIFSSVDGFKVALRRREGRSPTPVLEARIPAPLETETESLVDNPAHYDDEEDHDPFEDPFDDDEENDNDPFGDEENDSPVDNPAHDGNPFTDDEDDNPFNEDEDNNPFYDDTEQRRLNDLFPDEEQRGAWFEDRLHGRLHPPISSDSDSDPDSDSDSEESPPKKHSTRKCSLRAVLRPGHLPAILNYIRIVQDLARHTTYLIKWWIVNPNLPFPILTKDKITHYVEMINSASARRNTQERVVVDMYMNTFQLQHHGLLYCHQQALYLAESILTNLEVNVQEHMYAKVMEYVNRQLMFKTEVKYLSMDESPEGKTRLEEYRDRVRALKEDIRHGVIDATRLPDERRLARRFLSILPPERLNDNFDLAMDLHKAPEAYVQAYCKLNRFYEAMEYPLFNAVPLRRTHVQSSVHIDTTILHVNILGLPQPREINQEAKSKWDEVLRTDKKIFKKYSGLEFGHSIYTDGVAVSISMQVRRGGVDGRS